MNKEKNLSLTGQTEQKPDKKQQIKIELLVCQAGGHNCKEHLKVINQRYSEATFYHSEKDYLSSIESLKSAFFKTIELNQESCVKCAGLFRSTITQSLQNINKELQNLTTGLFSKKRYQKSYIASRDVLNEIKQGQ